MGANNRIKLCGTVITEPKFSHSIKKEKFYSFFLNVFRNSGTPDTIPCLVHKDNLADVKIGARITIIGLVRMYRSSKGVSIYVKAETIEQPEDGDFNEVEIICTVAKEPIFRQTLRGLYLTEFCVRVDRRKGKSDFIPALLWGSNARNTAYLDVGTVLKIHGRLQSREYEKVVDDESITRTTYEISGFSYEELEG